MAHGSSWPHGGRSGPGLEWGWAACQCSKGHEWEVSPGSSSQNHPEGGGEVPGERRGLPRALGGVSGFPRWDILSPPANLPFPYSLLHMANKPPLLQIHNTVRLSPAAGNTVHGGARPARQGQALLCASHVPLGLSFPPAKVLQD